MPRFKQKQQLKIIREDGNINNYKAVLCKCSCGKIIRCKKTLVKSGRKKSCGCIQQQSEYVSKYIMRMYWTSLILNAKNRDISFELDPKDLDNVLEQQNFQCKLSGIPISLPKNSDEFLLDREWTASVDRIDSSKNYTKDNIQFVHKDINKMKMNLSQKQFIEYCRAVSQNN